MKEVEIVGVVLCNEIQETYTKEIENIDQCKADGAEPYCFLQSAGVGNHKRKENKHYVEAITSFVNIYNYTTVFKDRNIRRRCHGADRDILFGKRYTCHRLACYDLCNRVGQWCIG